MLALAAEFEGIIHVRTVLVIWLCPLISLVQWYMTQRGLICGCMACLALS
jgi:hypothetical protein